MTIGFLLLDSKTLSKERKVMEYVSKQLFTGCPVCLVLKQGAVNCKSAILRGFPDVFGLFGP